MNNTITEIKNTLKGIDIRISKTEEQISDLEDRMVEITATKQNTEKRTKKKNEDSLRDFWNIIKCTNIHIIVIAEGEEREREPKKVSEEIITGHFPNRRKGIVSQIQESRSPRQDKPKEEHTKTHSNQTDKN